MRGGNLDRLIAIEQNAPTRNTHGEETEAWVNFATVWASKRDKGGREFFEAGATQAEADTIFKIRWLAGVKAEMRIVLDGVNYDIQAIKELGRREGLEIVATAKVE